MPDAPRPASETNPPSPGGRFGEKPIHVMNRNLLLDGLLLGAVALLAVITYQLLPLIAPRTDVSLPLSDCDLNQGSCQAALPEETLRLDHRCVELRQDEGREAKGPSPCIRPPSWSACLRRA